MESSDEEEETTNPYVDNEAEEASGSEAEDSDYVDEDGDFGMGRDGAGDDLEGLGV